MKAMILAAGFGTRLLPATEYLPKPCFPILTKPLILHIIEKLTVAGVNHIIINLHHLEKKIRDCIEESAHDDVTIDFSYEEEILGTAGGIKKVQDILKDDTFILHNGDIFSDVDLKKAVQFHCENSSQATMVVKRGSHPSFIGLGQDQKITRFPYGALSQNDDYNARTYFTGIHILEPVVFDYIPEAAFYGINKSVYPDMQSDEHSTYGFISDAYWQDIGTPADFLSVNSHLLGDRAMFVSEGSVVEDGYDIGQGVVIGKGCRIERGCAITDSVIFDNVTVKGASSVKNSIILDGCALEAGSACANMIITKDGQKKF